MSVHRDYPSTADMTAGRVAGHDSARPLDLLFVNAPLRDCAERPRVNDFTLPVLGMAYLATYAARHGFNVGVRDAEAHGIPVDDTVTLVSSLRPRWVGLNLLAPTYEISARIVDRLDPAIRVMLGGHQAKAMPGQILTDPRMRNASALVLGEGETRVVELLRDYRSRADLPGIMWLDPIVRTTVTGGRPGMGHHLAPDIDALPYVDRRYLCCTPSTTSPTPPPSTPSTTDSPTSSPRNRPPSPSAWTPPAPTCWPSPPSRRNFGLRSGPTTPRSG